MQFQFESGHPDQKIYCQSLLTLAGLPAEASDSWRRRGCSTVVVHQVSNLTTWVRFPSPAQKKNCLFEAAFLFPIVDRLSLSRGAALPGVLDKTIFTNESNFDFAWIAQFFLDAICDITGKLLRT